MGVYVAGVVLLYTGRRHDDGGRGGVRGVVVRGTALVAVGAKLGAALAFLVGRHAARPLVERRMAGYVRFRRIDAAIGVAGLKIVVLLRLMPLIPFNLLNYALGVTRVRLRDQVLGPVGMLPGTVVYVYAGRAMGEVVRVAAGGEVRTGHGGWILLGTGLLAAVLLVETLRRLAREAWEVDPVIAADQGGGKR